MQEKNTVMDLRNVFNVLKNEHNIAEKYMNLKMDQ